MWETVYVHGLNNNISYMSYGRKEGNLLFNDTFGMFYLWLYGIRQYGKGPLNERE